MRTALSTVNLVVGGIVVLGLACLALAGIIAVNDSPGDVPEALWTLLGVLGGALAAMLARTATTDDAPPPAATLEPQDAFYAEQPHG